MITDMDLYHKIEPFINDKGILEVVLRDKKKKFMELPKIFINELKETDNKNAIEGALKSINAKLKNVDKLAESAKVISNLGTINVILNAVNLCATCAGFAIMAAKLDKMSSQINQRLNSIKRGQESQSKFEFNKTVSRHRDMLDYRRRNQKYPDKEMRELVDDEYNVLNLLIEELSNDPVGDVDSLIFSIYSLAAMLTVSIRYFDEQYFFNNIGTITDDNPWHASHEIWTSVFDTMLSDDFVAMIQDHGFFDLNLSTIELDAYYISLCKQIEDCKKSISGTQDVLKKIKDKELYEAFVEYNKKKTREEFEKELAETGVETSDATVATALEEAYKQVALS